MPISFSLMHLRDTCSWSYLQSLCCTIFFPALLAKPQIIYQFVTFFLFTSIPHPLSNNDFCHLQDNHPLAMGQPLLAPCITNTSIVHTRIFVDMMNYVATCISRLRKFHCPCLSITTKNLPIITRHCVLSVLRDARTNCGH